MATKKEAVGVLGKHTLYSLAGVKYVRVFEFPQDAGAHDLKHERKYLSIFK